VPEIVGGKGGTRTLDPGIMGSEDAKKAEQLQQVAWCAVQLSAVCGPMFPTGCPLRGHKKGHSGGSFQRHPSPRRGSAVQAAFNGWRLLARGG
jgi:hypothetical protein